MVMATLQSSWEFAHNVGEPTAVIRVHNLQASLPVATDAWGREGKLQPVLMSAVVCLRDDFDSASSEDAVNESTIHYGILSKEILEACERYASIVTDHSSLDLRSFLDFISVSLTQWTVSGGRGAEWREKRKPVVNSNMMKSLQLKVMLPKASLFGSGVSITSATSYGTLNYVPVASCMRLALHDLRIPTLIGVNPNERLAKQIVIANIEIDRWVDGVPGYSYNVLEEIVVKTVEESSFQTLEALASHVGQRVIKYFLIHCSHSQSLTKAFPGLPGTQTHLVRVCLEKPTAVTFADAPAVELLLNSDPSKSQVAAVLWRGFKMAKKIPFPLQGRLDEWIAENDSDDTI